MEFDPFLYVAFGAGLVAGWVVRPRSPWVPRATLVTVGVLVGLLGASLNAVPSAQLLLTIPLSLGFALLVLGLTGAVALALIRSFPRTDATRPPKPGTDERIPLSVLLLAALLGGFAVGHFVELPTAAAIPWALYALLALVAFDLRLRVEALRTLWIPLTAAVAGAAAAALVFIAVVGTSASVAFATTFAFGWYTLAGPLVGARAGAALGLLAFLTNFLREDLTMLLSPVIGPKMRGEGLAALGGATSMDTTLYFVTRYGDSEAGSLALATGLLLTVGASLVLPLLLLLP
ncbi:MAG TPA: LysO family transporter [Thermoplasmata archaeon]|nr:LysO family transporter [Thermoplasmata archaeon]